MSDLCSTSSDTSRIPAEAARGGLSECGELPIRIGRDGTWFYHGSPITRKSLVCLFASTLRRDAHGAFWLETPMERGRIEVEDAPFVAIEVYLAGHDQAQVLTFRTNTDEMVRLNEAHPLRMAGTNGRGREAVPYLWIRDGLEAKVGRAVYYELVALGVEEEIGGERLLGVWSAGTFFPLGALDEPDGR